MDTVCIYFFNMKTINQELDHFRSVIAYDATLSRSSLSAFRISFFILFIVCAASLVLSAKLHNGNYNPALLGSALLFFALWLEQVLLYCYHNSFYYRGFDSIISSAHKPQQGITFEVAKQLLRNEADVTLGFCTSQLGIEILVRCNIKLSDVETYLASNRIFITANSIPLATTIITTVCDIEKYLCTYDNSFITFLTNQGVQQETFLGAGQFVITQHTQDKRKTRWWSRDRLSLHAGIGRSLSTGTAYNLELFSVALALPAMDNAHYTPAEMLQIQTMENILASDRASNIMVIAEDETRALSIIQALAKRVLHGSGLNSLAGLSFRILDTDHLLSVFHEKYEFETALVTIFDQAASAGTQVIVIPRISHAISSCLQIGVSLPDLLEVYAALPTIHCIGIDTAHNYHNDLQPHIGLLHRFKEVILEATSLLDTIAILQPLVNRQESRRGVLFTYDAIVAVTTGAERYITEGTMPEKAIDLIHDIAKYAQNEGTVLINVPIVQTFIAQKTGIPLGPITPQEKDRLLNLEQILSVRVVGQPQAVAAVARTMRRARVDIERSDKPIGSFLFLGPTGVGKTETAKALAFTFFGDETKMTRFDMSEFSTPQTLGYLIGDENGTGILTDKLQEHPYSLVLLDEFEKAHSSVHDLFLQILDEGYFTSTHGTHVNARNTIIIATSNAGSDLIQKTTAIRSHVPNLDADIINHIIETRVFKPELINRFDNTVIFEPLTFEALSSVAQLLIQDLIERVLRQGYRVHVTKELSDALVKKSLHLNSGGRGLNRIIQDLLEEKIAQKIIAGETQVGGYLHLSITDFTPSDLTISQ